MPPHPKPFRFALVSHSIEVVNVVRRVVDPNTEELFATIVGLDDAVPTAKALIQDGYDVILGHGGTGGIIAMRIGQPVVNIPITMLEVITALLEASKLGDKIGVTSFAAGREGFDIIRDVLAMDIRQIVFSSQKELEQGVAAAIAGGTDIIVGGGVSRKIATRLGARSVIIEPGRQIVLDALGQARALAAARRGELEHQERLQTIFKVMDDGMICIDALGRLNFYNQTAEEMLRTDLAPYLGQSVAGLNHAQLLLDALASGVKKTGEIINLRDNAVVVNCLPILAGNRALGAVSLLKEASAIQDIDRKLRERVYRKGFVAKHTMADIAAASSGMRRLITKAKRFAKAEATILVSGETGTGKEFLTHAIHHASHRKMAPFVAINCAALPEALLESELFGYEEGAFTGAKKGGKIGLFELAHHGTMFLDEIGDIPPSLQVRLLRVLENKEVMRLGGDKIVPVDVRVISSTHKDLREEVQAGQFRKDLYYRLAVLRLTIPPLRQRLEDIPGLLAPLLESYGKSLSSISDAILRRIHAYHWPGNIRELTSLVHSYLILLGSRQCNEGLFFELLQEYEEPAAGNDGQFSPGGRSALSIDGTELGQGQGSGELKTYLEGHKLHFIRQTLRRCGNNKTMAARELGISTNTLWRALRGESDR